VLIDLYEFGVKLLSINRRNDKAGSSNSNVARRDSPRVN